MAQTQYTNTLPLDSMLMEYKLTAILGVGGFGITYLAHDTHLEKDVAIKEYFPAGDVARVVDRRVELREVAVVVDADHERVIAAQQVRVDSARVERGELVGELDGGVRKRLRSSGWARSRRAGVPTASRRTR